jgi:hypothetical protein
LGLLLMLLAGCGNGDGVGPSSESPSAAVPAPADSLAGIPTDSTVASPGDSLAPPGADSTATIGPSASAGAQPGIVFATANMKTPLLGTVHTGSGRNLDPQYLLKELAAIRAKGGRVFVKMVGGRDGFVKNADGTFSLTKWKSLVDRYKAVNFASYVTDGTLIGHYLIDEPHRAAKWGGKPISQSTIEAMAKHSKQLWPGMTTFVRVVPSWLAQAPVTYTYLDAAWGQYAEHWGDLTKWITAEVATAKLKGLGLVVGLNVLDGGNGSSGIPGWTRGKYSMSASEIRNLGSALLSQSYACAFFMWMHDAEYYGRSDIKSAMADLSSKARAHPKTSCRQ